MLQCFLSVDTRCRDSWLAAFPALTVGELATVPTDQALVWALQPRGQGAAALVYGLRQRCGRCPIIVLADEPSEEEALAALAAGASGYCNGHASPQVLSQVAMAVENGGIWVGQGLMQRLLGTAGRLLPEQGAERAAWRDCLTAREQEAALLLAKGASNKEIARQLDITERTVKSHVSAMLEKLGVRDRLQLSLIINGVEKPR